MSEALTKLATALQEPRGSISGPRLRESNQIEFVTRNRHSGFTYTETSSGSIQWELLKGYLPVRREGCSSEEIIDEVEHILGYVYDDRSVDVEEHITRTPRGIVLATRESRIHFVVDPRKKNDWRRNRIGAIS